MTRQRQTEMTGGQLYGLEKKEEKGCKKTTGNQNQHDTYVIKIMIRQKQTKMTERQLYGPEKKKKVAEKQLETRINMTHM